MTFLGGDHLQRMAFPKQESSGREIFERGVRHLAGAVEIMRIFEHLAADRKSVRTGDRIVDVTTLDGHEAVEEFRRAREAIDPAAACGGVEQLTMMMQGFG